MTLRYLCGFACLCALLLSAAVGVRGEELVDAIANGDTAKAQQLMDAKPEYLAAKDGDGMTLLHWVVAYNNKDLVAYMLRKKADPNAKEKNGRTPLHIAAWGGLTEIAGLLLAAGAKIDAADDTGETPLLLAINGDKPAMADFLLARGVNFKQANKDGRVALHAAAEKNLTTVVTALLDKGAKINVKANDGATPLSLAQAKGNTGIVDLLNQRAGAGAVVVPPMVPHAIRWAAIVRDGDLLPTTPEAVQKVSAVTDNGVRYMCWAPEDGGNGKPVAMNTISQLIGPADLVEARTLQLKNGDTVTRDAHVYAGFVLLVDTATSNVAGLGAPVAWYEDGLRAKAEGALAAAGFTNPVVPPSPQSTVWAQLAQDADLFPNGDFWTACENTFRALPGTGITGKPRDLIVLEAPQEMAVALEALKAKYGAGEKATGTTAQDRNIEYQVYGPLAFGRKNGEQNASVIRAERYLLNEGVLTAARKIVTLNNFAPVQRTRGKWPLPLFASDLTGTSKITFTNPNGYAVTVGLRADDKGKDVDVPANGTATVALPQGTCGMYLIFGNNPLALFAAQDLAVQANDAEIRLFKEHNGDYGYRKIATAPKPSTWTPVMEDLGPTGVAVISAREVTSLYIDTANPQKPKAFIPSRPSRMITLVRCKVAFPADEALDFSDICLKTSDGIDRRPFAVCPYVPTGPVGPRPGVQPTRERLPLSGGYQLLRNGCTLRYANWRLMSPKIAGIEPGKAYRAQMVGDPYPGGTVEVVLAFETWTPRIPVKGTAPLPVLVRSTNGVVELKGGSQERAVGDMRRLFPAMDDEMLSAWRKVVGTARWEGAMKAHKAGFIPDKSMTEMKKVLGAPDLEAQAIVPGYMDQTGTEPLVGKYLWYGCLGLAYMPNGAHPLVMVYNPDFDNDITRDPIEVALPRLGQETPGNPNAGNVRVTNNLACSIAVALRDANGNGLDCYIPPKTYRNIDLRAGAYTVTMVAEDQPGTPAKMGTPITVGATGRVRLQTSEFAGNRKIGF